MKIVLNAFFGEVPEGSDFFPQTIAVQQKLVRPNITPGHADSESEARGIRALCEDCIAETGVTNEVAENASSCLEQALEEVSDRSSVLFQLF